MSWARSAEDWQQRSTGSPWVKWSRLWPISDCRAKMVRMCPVNAKQSWEAHVTVYLVALLLRFMSNKPLLHLNRWDFCLFQLSDRAPNRNPQPGSSGGTLFPAGPTISPKHKVENRYQGGDSDGPVVAARAAPAASQTPTGEHFQSHPAALCKALFDFSPAEMNLEDAESFLSFRKVWIANWVLTYCLLIGGKKNILQTPP